MVSIDKIREIVGDEETEEIHSFLCTYNEHVRQRVTDRCIRYSVLMQVFEELGEQCEAYELLEDPEEKRRGLRGFRENAVTAATVSRAIDKIEEMMIFEKFDE